MAVIVDRLKEGKRKGQVRIGNGMVAVILPQEELNDLIRALLKELNTGAAPLLVDKEPLVLYFGNEADREEMIVACKQSFSHVKTIKV